MGNQMKSVYSTYELLRWGIETHHSLTGIYENCVRLFSPHILGQSKFGEPSVVGFQYDGGRHDGGRPKNRLPPEGDWCFFAVRGLRGLGPNGDKWVVGPLESKPSDLIAEIDVQTH